MSEQPNGTPGKKTGRAGRLHTIGDRAHHQHTERCLPVLRIPEAVQRAILRQANDQEFERYVTHAHQKIRAPVREKRRGNVNMPAGSFRSYRLLRQDPRQRRDQRRRYSCLHPRREAVGGGSIVGGKPTVGEVKHRLEKLIIAQSVCG
jgi:hypothetical protein